MVSLDLPLYQPQKTWNGQFAIAHSFGSFNFNMQRAIAMYFMPDRIRAQYWHLHHHAQRRMERWKSWARSNAPLYCPICGWRGMSFLRPAADMVCPVCESRPRHRTLKLVLDELGIPQRGGRVLHVSPKGEEWLGKLWRKESRHYLSIDKGGVWNSFQFGGAMKAMDLRNLAFPDASFDFICCNHVLENITEDQVAINEIYRVLAPGGHAALIVQMYPGNTVRVESPSQEDYFHAWHPGQDYFDRYRQAGFHVDIYDTQHYDRLRHGLSVSIRVPICSKPSLPMQETS